MSRCFPFPPPGYEKKARPDDADLLKEEKQREKKHKKEKRDKEKREGKEKKEKDRSDGKHKEKKDRKEKHKNDKHRDKKKDKEKDTDKDKEKIRPSKEKSIAEQSESHDGEKLHRKEERGKDKSIGSHEKKPAVQFHGHSGEKPIRNSLLALQSEESKFVQELDRRIRDEQEGTGPTGSQLVDRFTGTEHKKDEGIDRSTVMYAGILAEGKEENMEKRVDSRKMGGQEIREHARFSGNAMANNIAGMVQNKVDGMAKQMEKDIERRMEGKEKSKERGDEKRGDKRKEKDKEKKSHGKDKNREKEKKKGEKAKEKSEHKKTDVSENDLIGVLNNKTSHPSKDCYKNAAAEGNLKKRKYVETNGFLHDNEVRLTKTQRPTSRSLSDNGKKLEPCQTTGLFSSDGQGAANNLKVDSKQRRVNGIIEAQTLSVPAMKPFSTVTHVDHIVEASRKPPHPDSKYLSQVLSVPKMEEWSDFDDQNWLFSSKDPPESKSEVGTSGIKQDLRVWAEALQIESADVCALPYVIPY